MTTTHIDPVPADFSATGLVDLAVDAIVEGLRDAAAEYDLDLHVVVGNPDRYVPGGMDVLRAILHNDGPTAIAVVRDRVGR